MHDRSSSFASKHGLFVTLILATTIIQCASFDGSLVPAFLIIKVPTRHTQGVPALITVTIHQAVLCCFPTKFAGHCIGQCCNTDLSAPLHILIQVTKPLQCRRDVSDRALRVLRNEAKKYSEVRSRLATLEGLQAAALFQQGLKQHSPSPQSPPPAGLGPQGNTVLQRTKALFCNQHMCSDHGSFLLCCLQQLA